MSLRYRSYDKELLDQDDIPFEALLQNLKELNTVNSLLGGHATTLKGLSHFLDSSSYKDRPLTIAEIGCGGGDNLAVVHRFLQKKNIPHRLIGVDLKPECIRYAAETNNHINATWICSDYRTAKWPDGLPDIIFSSLFCHHFTDEEMVAQLHWLQQNSHLGFFINDLHRHPFAYQSIRIFTTLFSKSYLVKNDAPLSVRRGFIKSEWQELARCAGILEYEIEWRWAFRYLVMVKHRL